MSADELARGFAQRTLLGEAADCLVGVAVFIWDDDRNYVAVNDEACTLVGRTRSELLAMKVGDMTAGRGAPFFEDVQRRPLGRGSLVVERPDGPVEVEWLTCHSRVAGLPYMVSFAWRTP
jgi:PAS domain-containing protein